MIFKPSSARTAAVAVLLLAVSRPGIAQIDNETETSGETPATEQLEAAPEAEQDIPLARARALVSVAKPLFDAGHYEAALAEYTRAYETLHGHPRQYWVLHNLAACNQRLFRYDLALSLYEEYLRRAPKDEPDREAVRAVTQTLRSLLGTLVVETAVPAELWVDDRLLGTAPGRWLVPTGVHIVELRAALYEPQRLELRLDPMQVRSVRFELQRLSTYRGPSRSYFWAAVGVTGAAAIAGTVFGVMALDSHSDGEERADLIVDTSEQSERTRRRALAADACFGGALVFGVTATILYFVSDWSDSGVREKSARRPATRPMASLALGPRTLGFALREDF